ncbi:protein PRRC2B-like isoform X2 [Argiope bruennichi]|uniref:protein PRRC2B-like isoform X2 n=1 Tax=Argiope bruennichi TaxID=94029 RepID=UPI002495947A|nr:protein PRRC2B-like isoform X2 [Argiope bruennichi]
MSAVSGLNAKAEKGRSKYVALDINSIYKGKSLENPKATVQPKHGLQSLGKVGTGRRMPPPANLPSLKSENSGNNPNISLVPSGGQGWGSTTKEKSKTEETNGNQQQSPQSQPASSLSQTTQKTSTTNTVSTSGVNKTWSSVTQSQEDGGQERNFLGQQSPFFPQEFPKLAGGDVPTEGNQKSNVDSQYGPGPSLRPQTEGSWGRGTLQQQPPAGSAGGQQQSSGSGVNGPQTSSDTQSLASIRDQRPYSAPRGSSISGSGIGSVPSGSEPPMGSLGHGPGMGSQMGPGSGIHPPPQYRGIMPSFMFGRNTYPSGYPSNYPNVPPPPPQQSTRPSYPYSENRRQQPVRPLAEEEAYQRPAAIITEKALKGFDEILQNDAQDTWATTHGEIDYNAKLVFSDDEESPTQKKDKRDADDKSSKNQNNLKTEKERDRKLDRERTASEREARPLRDSEWPRENRSEKKSDHESDWTFERGDGFDRDRERHGSYPAPRAARPGPRSSSVADEDEMWRQRRKQHTEEMTVTVERARQRRAEEEKHYEQSKQSAQEKAKSFEKCDKEKDMDIDDADRSRHSSESREDKPPSRDGRERDRDRGDRSQSNYPQFTFSRQFQKNVPPRFQKQQAEYLRQQSQQPVAIPSSQSGQPHFMRSQSVGQTSPGAVPLSSPVGNPPHGVQSQAPVQMPLNYDAGWSSHPSYVNQMPGMSPPVSKDNRQRSNSQGSGTDSYESDSCVPDQNAAYERESRENYWSRDRRQPSAGSYDNWHSPSSGEGYFDQKMDSKMYDQRHDFKKVSEKEEKEFDSHIHESERREKEFDNQDFRYKGRDSFKENKHSDSRELKDKSSKSSSWSNSRDYEDRVPSDPFDEPHETSREKSGKDRNDRYERQDKERWEKDRPSRPDSRDSRASRESTKDDRHTIDRTEISSQPERDRKGLTSREEKKEKSGTLDWGETPYPVESKRREWYHHPPPITPKQFESVRPPKKNLTPLRRSNAAVTSSSTPDKKLEPVKDDVSSKKTELDSSVKKEKDAKEEKNEKIKSESAAKDIEKTPEKYEQTHFEKMKSFSKESSKKSDLDSSEVPKKDSISVIDDKDKQRSEKEKHEHSTRSEQNRERRRDGRERGVNSRSRGGSSFVNNTDQPAVISGGGSARYESSRGRGGGNRSGAYGRGPSNVQSGAAASTGVGAYRGKREYRRSKVERGPRFDRQKERDKVKDDKKDKHSDDTSCSEVDEGKLGHLRQKDEDSEVSVDEASASTTESAQAEKYQSSEIVPEEEKNCIGDLSTVSKDNIKNDKYKKEKKDHTKIDSKPYDDRPKEEKGGFAPRGEPSRRGRGGGSTLSFRNSRGGTRYGPSSYGPPPSRAGFGGNKPEKLEEQKILEESFNDDNQGDFKTNVSTIESVNSDFPRESNKSRSLERPQQRRPGRYEHLPPRFQKRHDRRLEKFDQSSRGRGRGRSSIYSGSGGQIISKMGQGGKENLSDVANEEWETASESSDIAERRDRHDDKDDLRKKDQRDKGSSASRKSFSSQRPVNDSNQNRRGNESRRGGGPNSGDRNRQRDTYSRENRTRDSGRGRQNNNFGNAGERRSVANNGNNSRPSSSAGHPGSVGRNNGRGGNPSSKTGAFQPKNEGTAAVYRVDEIKLQDPNGVQAALTDLTNRRNMKAEVSVAKVPKNDKDKTGGLEGYDLNNYASVVIIDDHPEVGEDPNLLCGTDDGFQEVTSKKRHKIMIESEVKKMKKEPHTRNKSGSRSRQSRLPPRFAKQRESIVKSATTTTTWDINVDLSSRSSCSVKDASPAPPSVNAWEKPINHSLRSQSPVVSSQSTTSSGTNTIVSSCTPVVSVDVQALSTTSKSSSFDRSDQHDSGIDVSDQPASAASSQRSSPSNDCKIITPANGGKNTSTEVSELANGPEIDACKPMCTVVFENKNFKAENAVLDQFGGQNKSQPLKDAATPCENLALGVNSTAKSKESTPDVEDKSHCMPVSFSNNKESYGKGEETTDMKLDFNFDSGLERLTDDKNTRNQNGTSHMPNKSLNISRTIEVPNSASPVGVQSPISPSTDDLNLKIQSVKKVWENDPPLPTVLEHPQTVSEENPSPTSYNSFANNGDTSANVYNSSVDSSSQNRKEQDVSEISFRENSPLQQTCSSSPLVKSMDHNVSSVKSHLQMAAQHNVIAGPHCPAPLSPPLMGGLEAMTGIRTIAGLTSSVQVASIPAIPSPPTVLFNSSQQMAQTGMYQPLQMDSRQTNAAAVAAAMVQFGQSPHGYAPLGTYGLSHQPPPNPQLSNAYGQQSLFVQPPAAHQGQDIYSSSQYRVQAPYPQSQHVSSNQVLGAQQNIASSHLLGSQLVQTRPAAGPSPAAPHLQSLHGLQAPQTSYFSTSAQPQTANYYHQPPTTPGSPMQQQPQYPSHQSYGSQSALNVLPQTATVNPNYRNFGGHQYKAPNNVMNNIVPDSASLRSATRSPTIDVSTNRNMFNVSTAVSTAINSTPVVAVPPMSTTGVIGKHGQPQGSALPTNRMTATSGKTSQYSVPQSQQAYFQFGQQKFNHLQSNPIRAPQMLFPNVVRNAPHQQIPTVAAAAAASNLHYPPPIQRPGPATVTQAAPQPQQKIGIRPQASVLVPGGKLTSAQQAKLRAEAVQQTHMFFAQSKTGKHDESVSNMLSQDNKNNIQGGVVQKMPLTNANAEDSETQCLSSTSDVPSSTTETKDEKGEKPAGEE